MRSTAAYVLGLGLLAQTQFASGQGFIRNFDLEQGGKPGAGLAIREVIGGYLLFCEQVSADGTNRTRLVTRLLSSEGVQLSSQEICSTEARHYLLGPIDALASRSDGNFSASVFDISEGFDMGTTLFTFDTSGDTLYTHPVLRYPPLDSVVATPSQIRQCSDGGFYIVGGVEPYSPEAALEQALLVRTNAIGDTLWTALYAPSPSIEYRGLGVVEYLDGGAIVLGYRHQGFTLDECMVMRAGPQGNLLWTRYFGNRAPAYVAAVRLDTAGQIVTYSAYRDDTFPNWYWGQFMFTKWSPDGDIVWQKKSHYGNYYLNGDFEILPDNSIIAVGKHVQGAELMKFSSEGDSLWTRTYLAFASGDDHYLWDVQPTSDGGFVAAGSCHQEPGDPTPYLETEWILKTDSFGCVVPGCQNVGVQEYALDLNELLRIAPNPVHDVLTAVLPLPPGTEVQGAVRAVLLDAQGRQVAAWPMARSGDELRSSEDISALPSGAYYLHIADEKRWLAGGKVMFE